MEFWSIDGMIYVKSGEERAKAEADMEDYFGMDIVSVLTAGISEQPHEIYLDKFDHATIYKSGDGSYYFEVKITTLESYEMTGDENAVGVSETICVDAEGRVTAILDSNEDGSSSKIVFNSYGQTIDISAPENADEYELIKIDNGSQKGELDPEAYEAYVEICNTIINAEKFDFAFDLNDAPRYSYQFDGENEYLWQLKPNEVQQWIVDGKAYMLMNDEWKLSGETPTSMFSSRFETVDRDLGYFLSAFGRILEIEEMEYIVSYEDEYGNTVIEFEYYYGTNGEWCDVYTFTYNPAVNNGIMLNTLVFQNNRINCTADYWFTNINSADICIVAPC